MANSSNTPLTLPQGRTKIFPRTDVAVEVPRVLESAANSRGWTGGKQTAAVQQQRDAARSEQGIIDALANGRLPEELTLRILVGVVKIRCARVHLDSTQSLNMYLAALLGHSPAATRLREVGTRALLETADVQTSITFERSEPFVRIPKFVSTLPCNIWHLEIHCSVEIPVYRRTYPINLFRLTRGVGGLGAHFAHLHTLILVLDLTISEDYAEGVLDRQCFCGFSATTSFRSALIELLDAVRARGPGWSKTFTMNWHDPVGRRYAGPEIVLSVSSTPSDADASETLLRVASKATLLPDDKTRNAARRDLTQHLLPFSW